MKKGLRISIKSVMILLAFLSITITVQALPYTAVTSGNWSNPATWGGVVPPTNNSLDQIIIPAGKTVTMDQNCTCNGLLASLNVMGTLNSTADRTLTLGTCTLLGAGLIDVDHMTCNSGAIMLFTGSIVADVFQCSALNLGLASSITATEQLLCNQGILSILTGGHLTLADGADIVINGGLLELGNTSLTAGLYNVIYEGGSCVCGDELNGSGLHNVTVNVLNDNTVSLISDLVVNGTLSLTSGSLVCNGHDLTLNGDCAPGGAGDVHCTPASNITINHALSGILNFGDVSNTCNNFTCNPGAGNLATITGDLAINGAVNLVSGTLKFINCNIISNGLISGTAQLWGEATSNLTINSAGGLVNPLVFAAGGQTLNILNLNCGQGNSVPLGSDLNITGALGLLNGCDCDMAGQTLTLGANAVINGTGRLLTDANSGMVCNCSNGLPSLHLGTEVIGDLLVNCGSGNGVGLNDDLTIAGLLTLTSGHLNLNDHDLTIAGNIAAGVAGTITSTINSNLNINCLTVPSGLLNLTAGSLVDICTINLGSPGNIGLGSDLNIAGALNLVNGCINTGAHGINLGVNALVNGGTPTCYIITGENGHLGINLQGGLSGLVNFPVGTISAFAPIEIELNGGSGKIDVNVTPDVYEDCTGGADISLTQSLVDLTWHVNSNDISNPNMNAKPKWNTAAQKNGFNNQAGYVTHYNASQGKWDQSTPGQTTQEPNGMNSLLRLGLDAFGCISIFDDNTITSVPYLIESQFYVYPTLAKDHIYVQDYSYSPEVTDVEILNINGTVVKSAKIAADISELSLEGLSAGNYFVKLNNSTNSEIKKFIKQ